MLQIESVLSETSWVMSMQHQLYSTNQLEKQLCVDRWMSMGKIWHGIAEITGWALATPNTFVFPILLQELHLLCVIRAAFRSPQSVMQSATSHLCDSHKRSER